MGKTIFRVKEMVLQEREIRPKAGDIFRFTQGRRTSGTARNNGPCMVVKTFGSVSAGLTGKGHTFIWTPLTGKFVGTAYLFLGKEYVEYLGRGENALIKAMRHVDERKWKDLADAASKARSDANGPWRTMYAGGLPTNIADAPEDNRTNSLKEGSERFNISERN